MTKSVYVLQEYAFYEGLTIVMISKNYKTIKRHFDKIKKEAGHGYQIMKYECDSLIDSNFSYRGIINWIEVEYNGEIINKIPDGDK